MAAGYSLRYRRLYVVRYLLSPVVPSREMSMIRKLTFTLPDAVNLVKQTEAHVLI